MSGKLISSVSLIMILAQTIWGQGEAFVFEGRFDSVDPAIVESIKPGWVLSGSFLWDKNQSNFLTEEGFWQGGLRECEYTVDLYRVVKFAGGSREQMGTIDFENDDPTANGRDFIGINLPISSEEVAGWKAQWLQIWLFDSSGEMISTIPVNLEEAVTKWSGGWFRLTFYSEAEQREIYAEGELTVMNSWNGYFQETDPVTETQKWRGIVQGMSEQLVQRDDIIASLEEELAASKERIDGLRKMLDFMVEERDRLENEISREKELATLVDAGAEDKIGQLEADRALALEQLDRVTIENDEIKQSLTQSQASRLRLNRRIEEMEIEINRLNELVDQIEAKDRQEKMSRPIKFESVEKTVDEAKPTSRAFFESKQASESRVNGRDNTETSRAKGPRKFRY